MPVEAASLIERLQPFQRNRADVEGTPEKDALSYILQWLNNTDKHRVPSVILIAPTEMAHSWEVQFYSDEDAKANAPPDTTVWFDALQPGVVLLDTARIAQSPRSRAASMDKPSLLDRPSTKDPLSLRPWASWATIRL